jgi:hypothetical protein
MSTITWKRALVPALEGAPEDASWELYGDALRVPRVLRIPLEDEALVALPDPRAYRSLSRAGLMLAAVGLEARDALQPFVARDPYRIGVYCALERVGPNDYDSVKRMLHTPPEEFATTYRALRTTKQYFKMLPTVPPAQLAIFLGVMGPMVTFVNSDAACAQALDQAEHDLHAGVVDLAIACATFSLDDPLVAARTRRRSAGGRVLCEGAACLLLVRDGRYTDWRAAGAASPTHAFGIADQIVALALPQS